MSRLVLVEWETIISTIVGTVVGGVITLLISRHYFKRATEDLESKVYRMERVITAVALHLKHAGLIENVVLDERDVLKSFDVIRPEFGRSTSRSFEPTLTEQPDENDAQSP